MILRNATAVRDVQCALGETFTGGSRTPTLGLPASPELQCDAHTCSPSFRPGTIISAVSLGGEAEQSTWENDQHFRSCDIPLVIHPAG